MPYKLQGCLEKAEFCFLYDVEDKHAHGGLNPILLTIYLFDDRHMSMFFSQWLLWSSFCDSLHHIFITYQLKIPCPVCLVV